MSNSPFSRMTRRARGHTRLLLSVIPVALMLLGALIISTQQFFARERSRLQADFLVTVAYIDEQEKFLKQLQADAAQLPTPLTPETPPIQSGENLNIWRPTASVSFSVLCADDCPASRPVYGSLGAYLADSFASFWAMSYFPSSYLFLFHPQTQDSLSIPELDVSRAGAGSALAVHLAARALAQSTIADTASTKLVRWISLPEQPQHMLGVISIELPGLPLQGADPGRFQAVALLDKRRLREFFNQSEAPAGYQFWLSQGDQEILLGTDTPPEMASEGFSFGWQGLSFQIQDPSGKWTGRYLISPNHLLDNTWVPTGTAVFLFLSLLGSISYARWYRRRVIEPARSAQRALLDSEAFNRSIIDTSPVALCVLDRHTQKIIFGNTQALGWLDLDIGDSLPRDSALTQTLLQLLSETSLTNGGATAKFHLPDGRSIHLACASSRYQEQEVLLCVLMDLTEQEEIQRELERARAAADEASTAKSSFLATMSHEIRTPLYGVLGSLELLSMTALSPQQHQQVDRIQGASRQLLQIISDILDISRIEADQTQLESIPFDPIALVQECTATFAAMAQQKNVLLFCTLDPDTPRTLIGDPLHIRQILSNLISNAVKFTQAGHIIVRLRRQADIQGRAVLLFQVADSGVGIEHSRQDKLFTPFYVAHSGEHTIRGAGLGLSICARLAELMGSRIHLTSEPGLGSSFSFTLELELAPAPALPRPLPALQGMNLHVRSPHAELSEFVCAWLRLWGAQAQTLLPGAALSGEPEDVLLDVLMPNSNRPAQWPGRYLSLSARDGSSMLPGVIDSCNPETVGYELEQWRHGKAVPAQAPQPEAEVQPPSVIKANKPGLHVLVAEDNPLNQATLREQLEQLGCQVTLAHDGEEALNLWDEENHDLLLTDVNMPNMNGYELAQRLRAQGVQAPIIGITANALKDEGLRCRQSGMNTSLLKPMSLDTLRRLIDGLATAPVPRRYRSIFRATMSADLTALEQALQAGQSSTAKGIAHRISGALVVMGLQNMAASFKQMEDDLRQNKHRTDTDAHAPSAICAALRELIERA